MSRSISIGGVERADLTRLESFSFQETAYRGEAGQGGFDVDSEAGVVTVPAWKDVVATDSDGGQFFTGQTVDRGVGRGPFTTDADARWDVQVIDMNTIMDDILLRGSEWNRPEETDVERMQALVDFLNDEGYGIDDTYLLATAPEDMDEQDYRKQGVYPRSVADECAENSGKNWYIFWNPDISSLAIWYGRESSSLYQSDYGISSVLEDIDDYGATWAAEWPEESGMALDPSRVYSAVQVVYGTTNPTAVYVDRPATETAFKRREAVLFDASVKTETKATKLANHYLDFAESEDATITVAVTVPTTHVNAFRQGQRIAARFPHLGYDTPTFMRCRTRTVEPAGGDNKAPGLYRVTLVLKPSVKTTRFGGRPANDVPGQGDNDEDDGGSTAPAEPAQLETVDCTTSLVPRLHTRQFSSATSWEVSYGYQANGVTPHVQSAVYNNVPWPATACGIGPGAFEGYHDHETWFEFTAPAGDDSYLGLLVDFDATGVWRTGYVGGYVGGIAYGDPSTGQYGDVFGGISLPGPGSSGQVYIPRSLVRWGETMSLVVSPDWLSDRNAYFCSPFFDFPVIYGYGASGQVVNFDATQVCAVRFESGQTNKLSGEVSALGDVDGVNRTFKLIDWDGSGVPELTINGNEQSSVGISFNRTTGTATLESAPPEGAILLWDYVVGTLTGDVTLTPDPAVFVLIVPNPLIPEDIELEPDPTGFILDVPEPTVTV